VHRSTKVKPAEPKTLVEVSGLERPESPPEIFTAADNLEFSLLFVYRMASGCNMVLSKDDFTQNFQ
jgi:hypothetical protein